MKQKPTLDLCHAQEKSYYATTSNILLQECKIVLIMSECALFGGLEFEPQPQTRVWYLAGVFFKTSDDHRTSLGRLLSCAFVNYYLQIKESRVFGLCFSSEFNGEPLNWLICRKPKVEDNIILPRRGSLKAKF